MKKAMIVVAVCLIISAVWIWAACVVMNDTLILIDEGEYVMPATKGVELVENVARKDLDCIKLLERAVEAEAGNQTLDGRRRVAAVILNRVKSETFPDTIKEVLNQKNQFECVLNGSIYRVDVTEETKTAVLMELSSCIDSEILYFTAGGYNPYCIPMYKAGDHYFGR